MVADLPEINVDAAAQVAHAISTHATQNQFDYFTAVDDFQNDSGSETGSGMIGTIEFNSATMYRFATVSTRQLSENLNDPSTTPQGVVDFIKAFALSMPTGHQTSYAAHTRPAAVVVSVRKDQPVNLVSAFEKPVWSPRQGMVEESELRLARFMQEEVTRWGDSPILVAACYAPVNDLNGEQKTLADVFGPSLSFADILDAVKVAISGDNPDD
jgi:CRISPR system Cascade subunit CasC